MKLTIEHDTFFVIFAPENGTQPYCFWGSSPYCGLCTAQSIESAWRFDSREEALAEVKKHPEERQKAKVVRVNVRTNATIHIRT